MIQAVVAAVLTLVGIAVFRKDILLYLFDANQARAVGLSPTFLHYLLLSLLSLTIVAALQAVGIILTVAMLIVPGCIGQLLTDRFGRMLAVAAGASVVRRGGGDLYKLLPRWRDGCVHRAHAGDDPRACRALCPQARHPRPRPHRPPRHPAPTKRRCRRGWGWSEEGGEMGWGTC